MTNQKSFGRMGYAQHSKTEEWEPTKDRRLEGETKEAGEDKTGCASYLPA